MEPAFLLAAAAGSTVAGGATAAYGAHMSGVETARAAEFQKQQLDIQAQTAHTDADQAEAKRRNELTSQLETAQAIRAGRGVGSNSPTADAIFTSAIDTAEGDISTSRFNYMQSADLSRRASLMAERKARTSLLAGDLTAASDIFSTTGKAASIYAYPAKTA